jgi:phage host-nuclease inhibitor protein Gam
MSNDIFDLSDYLSTLGEPEGFAESHTDEQGNLATERALTITTDDEAFWAMRRLATAQRRVDEVKRQAQVELDRINSWVEANTKKFGREVEFFDLALSEYLIGVRQNEQDGRKSLDFPDGVVTSRITPSKVAVTDADAFIAWAEANGHSEWVRIKREADVSAIKKVVDFDGNTVLDPTTGTPIDGLQHTEGGISVSVKVAE